MITYWDASLVIYILHIRVLTETLWRDEIYFYWLVLHETLLLNVISNVCLHRNDQVVRIQTFQNHFAFLLSSEFNLFYLHEYYIAIYVTIHAKYKKKLNRNKTRRKNVENWIIVGWYKWYCATTRTQTTII